MVDLITTSDTGQFNLVALPTHIIHNIVTKYRELHSNYKIYDDELPNDPLLALLCCFRKYNSKFNLVALPSNVIKVVLEQYLTTHDPDFGDTATKLDYHDVNILGHFLSCLPKENYLNGILELDLSNASLSFQKFESFVTLFHNLDVVRFPRFQDLNPVELQMKQRFQDLNTVELQKKSSFQDLSPLVRLASLMPNVTWEIFDQTFDIDELRVVIDVEQVVFLSYRE